jgi:hypothetical protein
MAPRSSKQRRGARTVRRPGVDLERPAGNPAEPSLEVADDPLTPAPARGGRQVGEGEVVRIELLVRGDEPG